MDEKEKPPPLPRWVKIAGVAAALILAAVIAATVTGHGPGQHASRANDGFESPITTEVR